MNNDFGEKELQKVLIKEVFLDMGYDYLPGYMIAPSAEYQMRESFKDVLLLDKLETALYTINKGISPFMVEEVIKRITSNNSPSLVINNNNFHKMITNGIAVEEMLANGEIEQKLIWLFDTENLDNNDYFLVDEFIVEEGQNRRRADLVVFINGIPLVVIELKNPQKEETTISEAYHQLQNYKLEIPSLFIYNAFLVISDGIITKAGTITSSEERFMNWRSKDGEKVYSLVKNTPDVLLEGMFKRESFFNILKHFILFQNNGRDIIKILAGYHQYYAVNKAVLQSEKASGASGDRKIGVVWHTQGSGKSLSMVFYAGKLILSMNNPTIVVVTDRNDLDNQLFQTFANSKGILRQSPKQATSRAKLKELLSVQSGGIIFTTIQKFNIDEEEDFPLLTDRKNVFVIVDEAHRTQYGFKAKVVTKDDKASVKYGFAKYLRDALPNASFIGFTGTPVELEDKNTMNVFGNYIDVYDMTQSIEDKSTVKIFYENKVMKLALKDAEEIDSEFEDITEDQEEYYIEKEKSRWSKIEALAGSENRLKKMAKNIVEHFEERTSTIIGKAIIVVMSRRIAVELYDEITKLRPKWHNKDVTKGKIKVIMTGAASDPKEWSEHSRNKVIRKDLAKRMKDSGDELQIAIVRDMWLTGFDAPNIHTMYIDKPMGGHNLMQAIARVNRVFKDKPGGLIVDYIGIMESLKKALKQYTDNDKKTVGVDTSEVVALMREKFEVIKEMLHDLDYLEFFTKSTKRINIIMNAVEYILSWNEKKVKEFIKTVKELERLHSLCVTTDEAKEYNLEISFFKSVKTGILKIKQEEFYQKNKTSKTKLNAQLEGLISKSLITEDIIDIFEATGIEKPEISIFSEEFFEQIKNLKHKNIALEILKRLLKGQITSIRRKNKIESKKFSDMLNDAITRYLNKAITNLELIDELMKMAKEIKKSTQRGDDLGLEEDEVAFYDALADNESAKELIKDDILKKIARELKSTIIKNLTVDWTLKSSTQAQMRINIKKLLKKYKYPPDKQKEAVEKIIEQAEFMCEEELNNPDPEIKENYEKNSDSHSIEKEEKENLFEKIIERQFHFTDKEMDKINIRTQKLLNDLKEKKLHKNWRENPDKVRTFIENELEAFLPERLYDEALFEIKVDEVYDYFYECYPNGMYTPTGV